MSRFDPKAVEWYSGGELHTRPKRVRVNDVWENVFHFEKVISEDVITGKRRVIFRCHIGDNRIVEVTVVYNIDNAII